jgi:hypothetical protein
MGGSGLVSAVKGSSEHGNEASQSVQCWEFLEWLSNYWLLTKGLHGVI